MQFAYQRNQPSKCIIAVCLANSR